MARRLLRLCGQAGERGDGDAKERRCPQEAGVDIHVDAHPFSGVDGGKGAELRGSSELWGEGCDHSVTEYYCQDTHMQGKAHTTMCVYELMKG